MGLLCWGQEPRVSRGRQLARWRRWDEQLPGLAINKGQAPVAVVNPIVATAGPNQGHPAGGPRLLSLLENGQLSTLYDYGPFTADMILHANFGCVIGAANAVVMLLDDGAVPSPHVHSRYRPLRPRNRGPTKVANCPDAQPR